MTKIAAKGVSLAIEVTATPGTFTTIAQVRNLTGPGLSGDAVDVSSHELTPGFYRKFVQGFKNGGEVGMELIWDPVEPTHDLSTDGLLELFDSGTENNYRLVWPDVAATQWEFPAIVVGYEPTANFDEALTAAVTLQITGQPSFPTP